MINEMKKIAHLIFNSPGLRQSLLLVGGSLFAGVFTAVALILISRHLGPVLFAEFTVGYSLMVIITKIQSLGLNVAIQKIAGPYFHQSNWQKNVSKLIQVSSRINALIIIFSLVTGLVVAIPLSNLLHFSNPYILFGSFLFASVIMVFEYGTAVLQMIHQFGDSVIMLVFQAILKLLVAFSFQLLGADSVTTLFYFFYAVPLLSMGVFFKALPKEIKILPLSHDPALEHQLWRIMKHSVILVATVGIIDYLDILFVQRYTTPFETGIYGGLAQLTTAVTLVAYSLAAVLNARVARYHHLAQLNSFLKKSMVIVIAAALGFLIYLPLTHLSLLVTIGTQYASGEKYLPLLMLSGFMLIASVPFSALFYSLDHPRYFSLSGLGQILITVIGGVTFIPLFGLAGAAWVKVVTRLFLLIFSIIYAAYAYQQKKKKYTEATVVPSKI